MEPPISDHALELAERGRILVDDGATFINGPMAMRVTWPG